MAFWDDAKKKVMQAMKPRQQEENVPYSNRADGGFSGYQPRMPRTQNDAPAGYQRPGGVPESMMPAGVDASGMQHFQPVGGQTGGMRPMAQGGQQAANPGANPGAQQGGQPYGQPMPPQPQGNGAPMNQPYGQPYGQPYNQPYNPQKAAVPPQNAFGQQGNFAPQASAQPNVPQQASQTFTFSGGDSYVVDGNAYRMIFRVAQITGVPSCFRVIEFMYNNEAVIVNAEQVTDLVEADRCMDLIFGAACAMKQRLMRVSGKQIYLITPPQVYVAPFEGLRRAGMADIERRWPGAMQPGAQAQPTPDNIRQMPPTQGGFGQPTQGDFAGGFGRRAARSSGQANGYAGFGGFNVR